MVAGFIVKYVPRNPFVLRWCRPSLVTALLLECKSNVIAGQKDCFCRARAERMGQKNNVKEGRVPVFYIIIYRFSSQIIMLMKNISRCFRNPIALPLSA